MKPSFRRAPWYVACLTLATCSLPINPAAATELLFADGEALAEPAPQPLPGLTPQTARPAVPEPAASPQALSGHFMSSITTYGGFEADNGCDQCRAHYLPGENIYRLAPQDGLFRFRGWVDAGVLGNFSAPTSHFNGPYNAVQRDDGQFNQAYFIIDRALATDGSFSVGGRFDLLYGSDYFLAQSNGVERTNAGAARWNSDPNIGLAMPQAYAEFGTNKLNAKVGHFYTIVGYESVQSANNFFYSHAYSYQFAGPFTQWGALGAGKWGDNWLWQAGGVNGWNTLSSTNNNVNFLGSLKYTADSGRWWSSFAVITGDEQDNDAHLATVPNGVANRTRYSFIVSRQLGTRMEYVFHQWAGVQQDGAPGGGAAKWYGLDQYIYYRLNDCWRLGTRVEWFRDEDGTRVGLTEPNNPNQAPLPGSYGSWTIGANWTPRTNVVVRPELRWDSYAGSAKPYDDGTKTSQVLLGADAIIQF